MAKTMLPVIASRTQPASAERRAAILFALADVVGKPDVLRNGDQAAQRVFWRAYHADLERLPTSVLSRACATWRRSGEAWFPTPGQLLNLAKADEAWRRDVKLARGLERLSKARPPKGEEINDPAAWEDVQRRLDALKGRWASEDAAARGQRDAENADALAWYKSPRDWSKRPGRAA